MDVLDGHRRHIASRYFHIAAKTMKADIRGLYAEMFNCLSHTLNNPSDNILDSFQKQTVAKWSPEVADAAIQIIVVLHYHNHSFPFMTHVKAITQMQDAYCRSTLNLGYRKYLLHAAVKLLNEKETCHLKNANNPDFPSVSICLEREDKKAQDIKYFWTNEKELLHMHMNSMILKLKSCQQNQSEETQKNEQDEEDDDGEELEEAKINLIAGPSAPKKSKVVLPPPSAVDAIDFLQMDPLGEEVYAVGRHIIKMSTET